MDLCAERVATLHMYIQSGQTTMKRILTFRDTPTIPELMLPCGACREFLMQLSAENKNIEIMANYETRETIILDTLIPHWWGRNRYEKTKEE